MDTKDLCDDKKDIIEKDNVICNVFLTTKECILILSLIHTALFSEGRFSKKNKKILFHISKKVKDCLINELLNTLSKEKSNLDPIEQQKQIEKLEDQLFDELFPETISVNN